MARARRVTTLSAFGSSWKKWEKTHLSPQERRSVCDVGTTGQRGGRCGGEQERTASARRDRGARVNGGTAIENGNTYLSIQPAASVNRARATGAAPTLVSRAQTWPGSTGRDASPPRCGLLRGRLLRLLRDPEGISAAQRTRAIVDRRNGRLTRVSPGIKSAGPHSAGQAAWVAGRGASVVSATTLAVEPFPPRSRRGCPQRARASAGRAPPGRREEYIVESL